jgi:hypothetical protein
MFPALKLIYGQNRATILISRAIDIPGLIASFVAHKQPFSFACV